jgi:hypothetical protein
MTAEQPNPARSQARRRAQSSCRPPLRRAVLPVAPDSRSATVRVARRGVAIVDVPAGTAMFVRDIQ